MASTIWEHLDPTKPVSIIIIINTIVILIFKTPLPVQVYMFVIMIIGQKNTTISVIYCRTTRGSRSLQSMFIAVLLSLKNWKRHQGWETLIVVTIHSQFHIVINYIIPVKRVIQDQSYSVIQTKRILIFTIIVFFSI